MLINYYSAVVLTKCADLLPFFYATRPEEYDISRNSIAYENGKKYYGRLREVQLILLVRYDNGKDGKCHTYCKIKCPINPLPIRGEFEVVSLTQIIKYLEGEGWNYKYKLPISLLK